MRIPRSISSSSRYRGFNSNKKAWGSPVVFVYLTCALSILTDCMVCMFGVLLCLFKPEFALATALGIIIAEAVDEWIYAWYKVLIRNLIAAFGKPTSEPGDGDVEKAAESSPPHHAEGAAPNANPMYSTEELLSTQQEQEKKIRDLLDYKSATEKKLAALMEKLNNE